MKERPILFSSPMVRALLAGKKTQTRSVVKPPTSPRIPTIPIIESCPYGMPGERLWVRETFALAPLCNDPEPGNEDDWSPVYRADGDERPWLSSLDEDAVEVRPPCKPSIFMPRWASRLTLRITDVRVQRVQEISEADARAEGVGHVESVARLVESGDYRIAFAELWDSINGKRATWASNPYVWAITFEVVDK